MLEWVGEHLDRPLYVLAQADFRADLDPLDLPTPHFLCFLAADFTLAADSEISRLAQKLVEAGASYFVCWGQGCERAHDLIDDVVILAESGTPEGSVIMTTWHPDDSLEEALFFVLCAAWPDPAYEDTTGSVLAVSVGAATQQQELREALRLPHDLIARVTS